MNVLPLDVSQFFTLNASKSYNLYFHDESEEYWLWYLLFPGGVSTITVQNSLQNINTADIHLIKKQQEHHQDHDQCKFYNQTKQFTNCAKEQISRIINKSAKCTFHITEEIYSDSELPGTFLHSLFHYAICVGFFSECATADERRTLRRLVQDAIVNFSVNTFEFGCPLSLPIDLL